MRYSGFFFATVLATLSLTISNCSKDDSAQQSSSKPGKASLDATINCAVGGGWVAGDQLAVLDGTDVELFTVKANPASKGTATFIGTADNSAVWYARYPYSKSISYQDGVMSAMVPEKQTAVTGGLSSGMKISAGRVSGSGSERTVSLSPVCSYVKVELASTGINSIKVSAIGGEDIAGTFTIDCTAGTPAVKPTSGFDHASIATASGDYLETGIYYITVLPQTLSKGFSITLTDIKERSGVKEFADAGSFTTNGIYDAGKLDAKEIVGASIDSDPEPETELFNAKNRALLNTFLESYLSASGQESTANGYVSSQQSNGSWSDINYKDTAKSGWDATKHINRIVTMACAYHTSGDSKYLTAIAKALSYWTSTNPTCTNWWYNQINTPKTLGPAMLLIRTDLSKEMLANAIAIMDKATISMTGQNRVWLSGNVLMNAILKRDESLAKEAHTAMLGEIQVIGENETAEGIQYDWSFHQHGAQLQFGNYGLAFITEFSNWFKAWKGTCLEVTGEKLEIMQNYIYNGLEWVMWKGYFDHNACGRQVTKNAQTSKCSSAETAIKKMGLELRTPTGPRYFPKSDFGVYRTTDWYASVRMQSARTVGFEMTNNENMQGYFCADGSTLVRRTGNEYYNVSAVWNWRHIPGVTCYDNGKTLSGLGSATKPYNNTYAVFGNTSGDNMVIGMELNRDGLTAKKAWFFCPQGYVCLGAGITMSKGYTVTTGVEQSLVNGLTIEQPGTWIRHNGITYVPIDGKFSVAPASHTGSWASIYPTTGTDTKDLLDVYIDHGKDPSGASYAYMVVPTGVSGADAAAYVGNQVKVLSNTSTLQKVSMFGKTMTVNWTSNTATVE